MARHHPLRETPFSVSLPLLGQLNASTPLLQVCSSLPQHDPPHQSVFLLSQLRCCRHVLPAWLFVASPLAKSIAVATQNCDLEAPKIRCSPIVLIGLGTYAPTAKAAATYC